MSNTYIYLNTYANGYLYIGSHTWAGVGIDPSYHGSSKVASNYRWKPIKVELLEQVSPERKFIAEREWIIKYCTLYGIADCALFLATDRTFSSRYNPHGLMLNLHSNDMAAANSEQSIKKRLKTNSKDNFKSLTRGLRTPETRAKIVAKQHGKQPTQLQTEQSRSKAEQTKHRNNFYDHLTAAAHTKEANARRANTMKASGHIEMMCKRSKEPEAIRKQVASTNYSQIQATKKHRGTNVSNKYLVKVFKDNVLLTEGLLTPCCTKLGNRNWQCTISAKFLKGLKIVIHHGFRFELQ